MSESNSIDGYATNVSVQATGFQRARGVATASIVLISSYLVLDAISVVLLWHFEALVAGYVQGSSSTLPDTPAIELYLGLLLLVEFATFLVAGIVFLVWVRRARMNAELMAGPDSQRLRRGWAIGAWLCPVMNLWYPHTIMSDIYRASSRRQPVSTAIVGVWWAAMLANVLLGVISRITETDSSGNVVDNLYRAAILPTVGLVFGIIAAVLVGVIIARIRVWQEPYPTD
jgi:hypothetical protein